MCDASSKSWPMRPSTTPPAPPAAPSSGIPATARASARRLGMGICHSYAPDGRCISLLKILLTNACIYDCLYCVNRSSSNVPRARFTVEEVVEPDARLLRRNYIEGLFLSSGIIRSADYTMEQLVARRAAAARGARLPRLHPPEDHPRRRPRAGRRGRPLCRPAVASTSSCRRRRAWTASRRRKSHAAIRRAMGGLRLRLDEADRSASNAASAPRFAPAGQSTQMIVGADGADDRDHPGHQRRLYGAYRLRRVYYSAFSPIPDASRALPLRSAAADARAPALPGRLADALLRLRRSSEIVAGGPAACSTSRSIPKLAWALRTASASRSTSTAPPRDAAARAGPRRAAVDRILAARRAPSAALRRSGAPARRRCSKVRPFVVTPRPPAAGACSTRGLAQRFAPNAPQQLSLLADARDHPPRRTRPISTAGAKRRARWRPTGVPPRERDLAGRAASSASLFEAASLTADSAPKAAELRVPRAASSSLREAAILPSRPASVSRCSIGCCGGCAGERDLLESRPMPTSPAQRDGEGGAPRQPQDARPSSASARSATRTGAHYVAWFEPEHHIVEADRALLRRAASPACAGRSSRPTCPRIWDRRRCIFDPGRAASRRRRPRTRWRMTGAPITPASSIRRG